MERNQIPNFLKTEASSAATVLFCDNGNTITNPYDIQVQSIPFMCPAIGC